MKKIILSTLMLTAFGFLTQAQDISKNALGLRLGDSDGFGAEISYQRGLTSNHRLEFDLGWKNNNDVDALKIAGLYQWVWNIDQGFNWYAGVGGGLSSWDYNYHDSNNHYDNNGIALFAAGDVGIEYNFKPAPIQLSLDLRPELGVNNYNDDNFGFDIGFGIRYLF